MFVTNPFCRGVADAFAMAQKQVLVGVCFVAVDMLSKQKQTGNIPVELKMQWFALANQI
ncbi:hypothetical protein [Bacteroides bouchesdurhonensis]|uniref:hypothetical protein n=1 Tax=Bacteroides bouchesdurhonensis TaxID=1841855 RepID=UPI001356311A|nr:hypothetical protein [Bacteroides bouchesdurhonensis]